jgi:hypothetical protein
MILKQYRPRPSQETREEPILPGLILWSGSDFNHMLKSLRRRGHERD